MHARRQGAAQKRRRQLVDWRRQYLAEAGVEPTLAALAAEDLRWDLHALLELVERGCPAALAARILAPADDQEVPRA